MMTIEWTREPCDGRPIDCWMPLADVPAGEPVDASTAVAIPMRTGGRPRPVKLIQHPAFRRAADLGPDPRFTLAGCAPHRLAEIARAA